MTCRHKKKQLLRKQLFIEIHIHIVIVDLDLNFDLEGRFVVIYYLRPQSYANLTYLNNFSANAQSVYDFRLTGYTDSECV